MKPFHLVTSNENKLKEFQRFGLQNIQIEKGRDLPEVEADPFTVILYKSLEAGEQRIVEDTSLHIEGEKVGVNIRWLLDFISNFSGKKATWEVLLGVHNGETITTYQGLIHGVITDKYKEEPKGFGFDAYFIPDGSTETLYDLECKGEKDLFSARKKAVEFLQNAQSIREVKIQDIPAWTGTMQHEK
ncbi:hypothetical protein CVD28_01600 [Bacillus sp. M6-12]|uniref:non-canonical purine NTP pyrophosphatase n=1 Tax=Bacillus sp. M6-12 TaxID=2054166 RepID=UPI000C77B86D|nr:non-canonical purine NTP pyrophosphatase [Bacillus sp. M6-12]PLS19128.1 hypothetical protein CVD28_01600 [Bacillus sp. M6-12]